MAAIIRDQESFHITQQMLDNSVVNIITRPKLVQGLQVRPAVCGSDNTLTSTALLNM